MFSAPIDKKSFNDTYSTEAEIMMLDRCHLRAQIADQLVECGHLSEGEELLSLVYENLDVGRGRHRKWHLQTYTPVFLTDHANLLIVRSVFPTHGQTVVVKRIPSGKTKFEGKYLERLRRFTSSATHHCKIAQELKTVLDEIAIWQEIIEE